MPDAMTLSAHSSAPTAAPGPTPPADCALIALGPEHFAELVGLLSATPHHHAWLLAALERQGPPCLHGRHGWVGLMSAGGLHRRGRIVGVASVGLHTHLAWLGGAELPPGVAARLARLLMPVPRRAPITSAITGAEGVAEVVAEALWRAAAGVPRPLPSPGRPVRAIIPRAGGARLVDRGPQEVLALPRRALPAGARTAALEPATPRDLDALVAVDRRMAAEELGTEAPDAHAFAQREATRGRIAERRVWLIRGRAGGILFKADVGALTATWAHLAGVWTAPEARRHGLARSGVGELCHLLQRSGRDVGLSVYADNLPALGLYRALGFAPCGRGRVIWLL